MRSQPDVSKVWSSVCLGCVHVCLRQALEHAVCSCVCVRGDVSNLTEATSHLCVLLFSMDVWSDVSGVRWEHVHLVGDVCSDLHGIFMSLWCRLPNAGLYRGVAGLGLDVKLADCHSRRFSFAGVSLRVLSAECIWLYRCCLGRKLPGPKRFHAFAASVLGPAPSFTAAFSPQWKTSADVSSGITWTAVAAEASPSTTSFPRPRGREKQLAWAVISRSPLQGLAPKRIRIRRVRHTCLRAGPGSRPSADHRKAASQDPRCPAGTALGTAKVKTSTRSLGPRL